MTWQGKWPGKRGNNRRDGNRGRGQGKEERDGRMDGMEGTREERRIEKGESGISSPLLLLKVGGYARCYRYTVHSLWYERTGNLEHQTAAAVAVL